MADNLALLISGEIRTFVLNEQIDFYKRLLRILLQTYKNVDVYMVLKIPSKQPILTNHKNTFIQTEQGIENFKILVDLLKPKYIHCFYDFKYIHNYTHYTNGQLKMIDMCIEKALEFQKDNNIIYDTFFRIRPDSCILLKTPNFNFNNTNIFSGIKCDAFASDQVFAFGQSILNNWWLSEIRPLIYSTSHHQNVELTPEYVIFQNVRQIIQSNIICWLVRDYNLVSTWSFNHIQMGTHSEHLLEDEYKWGNIENYNKLCLTIDHDEFINKLIKIVDKKSEYIEFSEPY